MHWPCFWSTNNFQAQIWEIQGQFARTKWLLACVRLKNRWSRVNRLEHSREWSGRRWRCLRRWWLRFQRWILILLSILLKSWSSTQILSSLINDFRNFICDSLNSFSWLLNLQYSIETRKPSVFSKLRFSFAIWTLKIRALITQEYLRKNSYFSLFLHFSSQ